MPWRLEKASLSPSVAENLRPAFLRSAGDQVPGHSLCMSRVRKQKRKRHTRWRSQSSPTGPRGPRRPMHAYLPTGTWRCSSPSTSFLSSCGLALRRDSCQPRSEGELETGQAFQRLKLSLESSSSDCTEVNSYKFFYCQKRKKILSRGK